MYVVSSFAWFQFDSGCRVDVPHILNSEAGNTCITAFSPHVALIKTPLSLMIFKETIRM
jgi:hypothetical protein